MRGDAVLVPWVSGCRPGMHRQGGAGKERTMTSETLLVPLDGSPLAEMALPYAECHRRCETP